MSKLKGIIGLLALGLAVVLFFSANHQALADTCPNAAVRVGPSAALSDCRAYELVTPSDTVGRPRFHMFPERGGFATPTILDTGDSVLFGLAAQGLAGTDATGSADKYVADRGSMGWSSRSIGPNAAEAELVVVGGTAAEFGHSFWGITKPQSMPAGNYLRLPDGALELLGAGSIDQDQTALGRWISPSGDHVIFTSEKQLEPEAPGETGSWASSFWGITNPPVNAVYEWTPSGVEVLSLLPGDVTPPAESLTNYWGTSKDGSSVVFTVGEGFFGENATIYVRRDGVTYPMATTTYAEEFVYMGSSSDGGKVYYFISPETWLGDRSGALFVYDVSSEQSQQVSSAADVRVVNVSEDGSHVYFISEEQLEGSEGSPGALNLYVWNGTSAEFIAELAPEDIESRTARSLDNWPLVVSMAQQVTLNGPGVDPSETSPDGSTFVFEARSNLTGYESEGRLQVYRYSTQEDQLTCVSCPPGPPVSDAFLQGMSSATGEEEAPTAASSEVRNVTPDGREVFYMTSDPLVSHDTDEELDVYEWKVGDTALISYGRSTGSKEWLYGVSPDAGDVFITSADRLVPEDESNTVSIYDARANGGFVRPPAAVPCVVGSCQGPPSLPSAIPAIGTSRAVGSGNVKAHTRSCKKLKAKKKRRCRAKKRNAKKNSAKSNGRAG